MKNVNIYTDGACRGNPGPGGYGVILEYVDQKGEKHVKEISEGYKNTTNNRMELMAVIKGLEALVKPCNVKIFTDSKYIVNAINLGWLDSWILNNWKRGKKKEPVKNEDLWKQVVVQTKRHQIEWVWVKGHDGHPQNERCDELATTAADGNELFVDEEFRE